jgi:Ribosomal protein L24
MRKTPIPYAGKIRIKTGDRVMIISGKDKGQIGTVTRVLPTEGKVVVMDDTPRKDKDGNDLGPRPLNRAIKHIKGTPTPMNPNPQGGRIEVALPIAVSKVALVNADGQPTRVRIQINEDGTKTRIAVKGGQPIPEPEKK